MLVELPSFPTTRDVLTMMEERKCVNKEKKNMENNCLLIYLFIFCSLNSKKQQKQHFFCYLKIVFLRTREQ